jgi:AcrR family transcriptional regulator
MPAQRRVGSTSSETRARILEAAEQLMIEEGYTAVTSRSVAARVGINAGLVRYYFPTIDDLFVAVFSRGADRNLERLAAALVSPEPLLALWRLSSDRRGAALFVELMSAAIHREGLQAQVTAAARSARRMQVEALRELLPQYGLDEDLFPPALVAAAIQALGTLVVREEAVGIDTDHEAVITAVEAVLGRLEQARAG